MTDLRKHELQAQQQAALIKLNRELEELERFGAGRVRDTMENVADDLDLETLKSIVFDIDAALAAYQSAKKELRRI